MTRMKELVLATTNGGKVKELREMLAGRDVVVKGLGDFGVLDEPEETAATFAENARQKALYYGERLGGWVLADDSGLEIEALGGKPGVYSARFAGCDSENSRERDAANNAKVLGLLKDVPDDRRGARFCCALCLVCGGEVQLEVQGEVRGVIGREPRGTNGFGYDPLFYVPGLECSVAELPAEKKNAVSHRGNALRLLLERMVGWLG
ncbi:MAG: RdgB/HAM1 family non-canonical purine NTP pyrophosphatase [Sedimentisphaerales bacterium]|nr:RdgB/HAM1 family non-canonical purine NTP pyrophosphatase [Sedimentisphaerales bacterium]